MFQFLDFQPLVFQNLDPRNLVLQPLDPRNWSLQLPELRYLVFRREAAAFRLFQEEELRPR